MQCWESICLFVFSLQKAIISTDFVEWIAPPGAIHSTTSKSIPAFCLFLLDCTYKCSHLCMSCSHLCMSGYPIPQHQNIFHHVLFLLDYPYMRSHICLLVLLCVALPYLTLHHFTWIYITLSNFTLAYHTLSYLTLPYFISPCLYVFVLYCVLLYFTLLCLALPYLTWLYFALLCFTGGWSGCFASMFSVIKTRTEIITNRHNNEHT